MKHTLRQMNHFMNLSYQLGKLFCCNEPLDDVKTAHDVAGDLLAERVALSSVPALWLGVFFVMLWFKTTWLILELVAETIVESVKNR